LQTPTASQQEVLKPIQDGLIYSESEASFLAPSVEQTSYSSTTRHRKAMRSADANS
jgi:hypothetical protein